LLKPVTDELDCESDINIGDEVNIEKDNWNKMIINSSELRNAFDDFKESILDSNLQTFKKIFETFNEETVFETNHLVYVSKLNLFFNHSKNELLVYKIVELSQINDKIAIPGINSNKIILFEKKKTDTNTSSDKGKNINKLQKSNTVTMISEYEVNKFKNLLISQNTTTPVKCFIFICFFIVFSVFLICITEFSLVLNKVNILIYCFYIVYIYLI